MRNLELGSFKIHESGSRFKIFEKSSISRCPFNRDNPDNPCLMVNERAQLRLTLIEAKSRDKWLRYELKYWVSRS